MSETNKLYWHCPSCGTMNEGAFCTNCGAAKPETKEEVVREEYLEAETPEIEEPVQAVEVKEPEPITPPKEEPVRPASNTNTPPVPKQEPTVIKEKKSNPFLTILLAGVVGLGAGYGGGLLAAKNAPVQTETIVLPAASETSDSDISETATVTQVSVSGKTIQEVAESASKAVVEIQTENTTTTYGIFGGSYTSTAAGSGVIISEDGYIITNNHVVEGSQKITVTTYDGTVYEAQLIGTDEKSDIGVIKIDASGLNAAVIGDSDSLRVGDTAIVIGNPLGTLGGTVTDGIISATDREMVINNQSMNLIQTNAAINSGNSGGGLFDANGSLVGIVNAKDSGMTSSGTVIEGLGFAIPINTAYAVAQDLIEHGYVTTRPTIGIALSTLESDYGEYKAGLYVAEIYEGSGAEAAGLMEYDRIVSADGTEVNSYTELSKVLAKKQVGDTLVLELERDGNRITADVVLTGPLDSMR